jgi:poly-gamma-glutamate synthesis protein (capsule biosynthesis protein)
MKLLITGDLAIIHPYDFTTQLDKSVIDLFSKSDINIVNLEAPVTESKCKILKTGPHLKSHKQSLVNVFRKLKVDVATLANNHILDYGEQGVFETISFCETNYIKTVGAGINVREAQRILYLDTEEGQVAIINIAENEWASATKKSAGANPIDIIDNAKQINEAKQSSDYVIVIVHGGHEYYSFPSPRMQKQYRFYADQGANIIVGHHTHCISGNEIYNGVPIYYSLGNFLFTKNNLNDEWYTGLVLEVDITNESVDCHIHPIRQEQESFQLSLLEGDEKNDVFERINSFSTIIADERMLDAKWNEYIDCQSRMYLNYWSPLSYVENKYINAAFRKLIGNMLNKKGASLYLNLVRCEAHRDLSEEVLKKYIKE